MLSFRHKKQTNKNVANTTFKFDNVTITYNFFLKHLETYKLNDWRKELNPFLTNDPFMDKPGGCFY